MRVVTGLQGVRRPPLRAVVTMGMFDGVHVAHQQLIRSTIQWARRLKGTSVVITFDPDPQCVLRPRQAQPILMPLEARIESLRALGVDWVWIIPFTKRFARMNGEQFIRGVLVQRLRATAMLIGAGFAFGQHRRGDVQLLQRLGSRLGMRVMSLKPVLCAGTLVSSSRIRRLIRQGQLAKARQLLGRAPALYGVVVRGVGRGRHLGFPTANIRLSSEVLPPQGVYAVWVHRPSGRRWRGVTPPPIRVRDLRTGAERTLACGELIGGGVMNLGVRPTFGPGKVVCEVHLLKFSGNVLGQAVCVSLIGRLRSERCFASPQALSLQIRRDLVRARRLFTRHPAS